MPDVGPVILVAATADATAIAERALGPAFSYRTAHTLEDAISRVCPEIDLILCNVAFDSSRMFDLLRAVRSREAGRTAPIIFFRLRPLSKASHHALELCAHEFERVSFVDLHEVAEKDGMPAALLALREAVYREIRGDLAG